MTLSSKNGIPLWDTPYREVLQKWRISLASLLLFTVILTDNFGVSCSSEEESWANEPYPLNPWIQPGLTFNLTFNSAVRPTPCSTRPATLDLKSGTECVSDVNPGVQCLYLRASSGVCTLEKGMARAYRLRRLRLSFCTHHPVEAVLNISVLQNTNESECESQLQRVQKADEDAHRIYCEFEHSLSRYDCHNGYSVKWKCEDCKAAYKNWVCAMFIPFFRDGHRYPPCRDFCHLVEQQCPYFLPDTKLQYAGESAFICTDPDIPEEVEMEEASTLERSPHADLPHCYLPCHLGHGPRDISSTAQRCHPLQPPLLNGTDSGNSTLTDSGPWARPAVPLLLVAMLTVVGRTLLLPPFCLGLT